MKNQIKRDLFNDKRAFLMRDFLVASILFGMVISLYILQVSSLANNYGNTEIISPSFANHYSTLQQNLNNLDVSN